jgi:hypothetical protein
VYRPVGRLARLAPADSLLLRAAHARPGDLTEATELGRDARSI